MTPMIRAFCVALLLTSSFASAEPAPAAKVPEAPKGAFELVEWVVLVVDPNRANANEAAMFKTALPGFARGRRPAPVTASGSAESLTAPSPIGVIRLKGAADEETIDVLLQVPKGRILSQWPQGKARPNRQLWERVALKEGKVSPVRADAGHWFETLRQAGGSSPLSTDRWSEQFLAYDAEVGYPGVLRVKAVEKEPGGYQLANAGSTSMRDVEVYAPAEGGWRVAGLAELPGAKPQPTTKPAGKDKGAADASAGSTSLTADVLKQVFGEGALNVKAAPKVEAAVNARPATGPATTRATTRPGTQPATQPVAEDVPKDAWRDLKIAKDAKPLSAADALAAWRPRLTDAGVSAGDVDVILATLQGQALDPEQLTVVYRIGATELDQLLPLDVVPMPVKTTRVGLVVVKNIDPAAGERVAKLIAQLGDPEWDKREAAQTKLAELGAGARPKLLEAIKNPDVEIAYRAERLLDALNAPQ